MAKPYPAHVVWRDAHSVSPAWEPMSQIDQSDCIIDTLGWVIPNAKEGYTVVVLNLDSRDSDDPFVGDGIAIPNGMIVSEKRLKLK